jgi:hypothetical protein
MGSPTRPKGVAWMAFSRTFSGTLAVIRVSINPGANAFTRIPYRPSSNARVRVSPTTPALEAA